MDAGPACSALTWPAGPFSTHGLYCDGSWWSAKWRAVHISLWCPRWHGGKEAACNAETQVQFLGQEDPLEEGMVTHSSILAWKIPWTQVPGGLQSMGRKESDMTEQLHFLYQFV